MSAVSVGRAHHPAFVAIAMLALSGCISPRYFSNKTVDVTNKPAWWGALTKGQVLVLTEDALLGSWGLSLGTWVVTGPYGAGERVSVEQYKANPSNYPRSIRLVTKGTRMRCVKLERFFSLEYHAYRVYVAILDGDSQGQIANIPVTGDPNRKGALRVNARYLVPSEEVSN